MKITETDTKFIIGGEVQCDSCGGTGLYCGMAEGKGAAVVCSSCNGTGKVEIVHTYNKFTNRKNKKDVKRVYKTACGYGIQADDYTDKDGKTTRFSKAGASYKDWQNGKEPLPIEDLHCPYMHTNQSLQHSDHRAHKLYEDRCNSKCFGCISDCQFFKNKQECWKIYKELGGK